MARRWDGKRFRSRGSGEEGKEEGISEKRVGEIDRERERAMDGEKETWGE